MAFLGFSANNFGTEGPRDLKFGLLASPGVGLPRTRIKKNRVSVLLLPVVSLVVLIFIRFPEIILKMYSAGLFCESGL